ncbi:Ig-like domain-containing protein [Moritella marina]|uniref:Ig-like domain-containing protein n=1 Tax=Moritella marina TaxID=90736 RepID=UPI003704A19E
MIQLIYSIDENGVITLTAAGAQIVNDGGDLPDFTVDATSTTGDSGSAPVNPGNTLDTNDGLTVTISNVMGDINEGDADTDTVVANASSTNPDGSTVTLTVSDTTNYSIDANGVITLTVAGAKIVNDGGDLPDFTVDATSTTGDSGSAPVNPGNTLDTDDGLTVTVTNVIGDINEGDADTDTVVANASSTNPDGSTVTLTVSDTTHYSIDENGVITLTAAGAQIVNNGGDLPDFTVDATSTTGDSGSAPVNPGNILDTDDGLTVTVTNVIGDINEGDADTDTVVANASSTNPDGSTVTLTVSDTSNYSIDANGVITLTAAGAQIVNDGGDLPDFTVDATSTTGDSGSAPVQPGDTLDTDDGLIVTVTNVIGDINEGDADTDTVVANASSTNPDGSTVTLTVSDTTNYSIDANGVITLTVAGAKIVNDGGDLPDFTVDATSTTGDSGTAAVNPGDTLDTDDGLIVTVTNVIGDINEGDADTDTVVANASSTNPDGSTVILTVRDTVNYSIDANGVITLTAAGAQIVNNGGDLPDFTVDATSTTGDSGSAPVNPGNTLDTDDGLIVTVTNVIGDINEGDADTDTVVANASSTNPDGSTVTLTVSDTTHYSIDANGVITLTAAGAQIVNSGGDLPDFTVDATSTTGDSGSAPVQPGDTLDTDDGLTVTISNVMGDINEGDADTDTVVANASSTNPDGSTVILTVRDTVNYSIDANGVITLTAAGAQIVNNGGDLPDFTVDATSTTGDSGSAPVNPGNTLDTDDGLIVTVTNVIGDINEGDADTDTVVANASSTNPDGSTVTLTVSDTTHYSIDANGVITLTVAGAQIVNNGGDLPDFTVDATSTTGDSGSAPVQPGDTLDTDDGLTVTISNVMGDINEGDADTDTVVANASSTNPDGSTVTLAVSDTANYSIDANGVITLTAAGAQIVNDGGDLPDFTVDATSTTGDSGSAPVQPGDTLDTDDGLTVTISNVMGDINEGDADTDTVVANASSTNPDGSTVTLTVSDTANYSIDANGVITLTAAGAQIVNDGGDLPDFTVDATSTTGDSGSAPVQPGDTLDTDDGLTVTISNVMGDINEGDADTDTVVANASSTNPDGSTVTLTVSDTTNYSIDANGVITLTAAGAQIVNNGGDLPDFTVDATSTTGDSGSAPVNPGNTLDTDDGLTVTISNVMGDISEGDADTDTVVANASSTNPDGSTVTLTLSDTTNYSIDANGVITLTAAGAQIVNSGGDLPDFTVDATSTTGDSGSAPVNPGNTLDTDDGLTVTVTNVIGDINEGDADTDTVVANASSTNPDGSTVTLTLSDTVNYSIDANGVITLTVAGAQIVNNGGDLPDFTVDATSTTGDSGSAPVNPGNTLDTDDGLTVTVTNVIGDINEGDADTDTVVANASSTNPDGSTVTLTVSDTTNYSIDANGVITLTAAGAQIVNNGGDLPDFTVDATSTTGDSGSAPVNPGNTLDTNDGLTVTISNVMGDINEGDADTGTVVANASSTNPDGSTVTLTVSDTTNYSIDANGVITLTVAGAKIVNDGGDLPDFTVDATSTTGDSGSAPVQPGDTLDTDDGLTVTISNVMGDINEGDADTDTVVANASSTNPDGSTVTLTVSDTANYSIDENGVITLTAAGAQIVNSGGDLPDFTVDATSTTGDSGSAPVNPGNTLDTDDGLTVTVTNVIGDINEGDADTDTVVANASSTNPDGSTVTLTVSDTTHYSIDENGVITLTAAGAQIVNNGGDLPDFTVDATSTTGDSGSAPVNPGNTLDTNDGLTVTISNVMGDINEGDADTDTVVANASSTNPDGSTVILTVRDTVNYSIDANGVITLTAAGAQIVNNGGDLPDFTVDATSTTGDSGSAPVNPGNTLDTDDGLIVTVTNVIGDINEGDADTDTVVANASSTNPDGSTVTLTVSDTTHYSIDANGVITLTVAGAKIVNDGGDLPDFTVDATSTTGDSGSAPVNPGNTLDTDDGLIVTVTNVIGDINEGDADTDTVVANASSTNPDGSTVTLTVSDTANYSIDENGVITLTAAGAQIVNNGGDLPDFTVDATSTTGDSGSAPVNPGNTLDTDDGLIVTVTNVIGDINEGDADTDTVVANASSTNPDGSTVTLTVSDTTNYSIDANGVITLTVVGAQIVNNGGDLPDFTVDATSTTGDSGSAPVNPGNTLDTDDGLTVTVTNVIGDINEGDADTDTVVANASSTNPDGSTVTLTVSDTTNYSIDENGVITLTAAGAQIVNNGGDLPDFTVDATSTTGDSGSAPVQPGDTLDTDDGLTVTISNVMGDINEGDADTDTVVANASSTNPDGSTVTLTVSDTTNYSIDANGVITLTVAGAQIVNDGGDLPDFTVDATSTTGDSGSAPVNPGNTLDTDDGLTVTISNVMADINEGDADTDTVVANASSTNPDGSTVILTVRDTVNYSIDANGVITLTAAGAQIVNNGGDLPDFTVDATSTTGDSGSAPVNPGNTLDTDDGLTVTVTNVIGDINEGDADTDTVVANASSTNPDGSTVTLTVSDTTHYSIDENGVITLTAAGAQIVNNGGDLPDFTVDATSTTGDSGSAPVQPGDTLDTDDGLTVTVTNVMGDINEGDADTDTVVANASSTNPDGSTVTLTVSDTTNYSIDENGVITLTAAGAQLVNNGGDLPDFTVDATSTTGDSGSAPVNPGNTLDTDDGLTVTISNVMGDINEGGADTDTVVANASSTNPDGSTVTLTVSDTAHYSIDENGVITLTAAGAQIVNNGGDLPDFTVDATSTTGDSGSAPVNPGNTLDTNDGLTVTISNVMGDINEGDADTDTVVANASSTNPDGSTVTLTVSDTTNYSIDANGVITLTVAGAKIVNDGGDLPDFTVDATSTTGDSGSAPVNPGNTLDTDDGLTVTVTNVIGDINEGDADTDTVVANASSTNPDGSTVTLTVSDTTHYSIDENGVITLTAAGAQIVNNGGDLPDFTVDATSTTGDSGSAPVNPGNTLDTDDGLTVTVTNVIGDINEGDADTDTVVANASSTNPDGSTVTLTVSDTTHYSIDANGVITLTVAGAKIVNDGGDLPDFTVDATSTTGDSGSAPVQPGDTLDTDDGLTVTISNVMGDINEGDADTDTVVANASSTNPDGSTVTLTVSDTANYSIDENGVITLTAAGAQLVNNGGDLPDFTVDATSTTGDSGSAPVNPGNTLDTNDGLTVTISNVMGDINEGDADTDTVVANASSTNPDGSTVTLTLSDTVNYSIDANGVITLTAAGAQIVNNGGDLPDFTVDATSTTGDSGSAPVNPGNTLDTDDGLTVTVTNVMGDINEGDADTDTVVANASSTNPDGSTVTLTVSDTTHYSIDENGVITLTVAGAQIVNDGGDLPDFTVDATSTTGDSGSAPVQPGDTLDTDDGLIVTVTNVIGDINEGDADTDTVVGNASSTNPDGSTVTLTVSDTANYSIDANGIITLTVAGAKIVNNGGDLPDFTVDATSTTGDSGSAPVNPGNTLDTDDGLIVTVTNVMGDINEGDADTDTVVANASSTNPDGSTVTLTVSDTTHYSIDANGVITLTVAGAQIVNDGGDLPDFTVDATSTTGDSGSAPVQPGDTLDTDDGLTVIVTNVMGDISEGDADTDTVVANASSTNPDGSTVTLTVSDTTNYSIDENGVITLTAAGAQIVNSGGDLPDFTVDATSTTGDSGSAPVNPGNTLDTDDGLTVTVTNVIGDINEGDADTDTVVANASSTNPDGSTVTLTVSDTTNYSIDENGVITLTAAGAQIVNNGGDLPDFTVDATSTTGDSGSAPVQPGDTLDTDDGLTVTISNVMGDINEGDADTDTVVANASSTNPDGSTVTLTVSDTTNYSIDANGVITLTVAGAQIVNDGGDLPDFTVDATSTTGDSGSAPVNPGNTLDTDDGLTVTISNVMADINEGDADTDTVVANASSTNPDGSTVILTVRDTVNYSIDANGVITLTAAGAQIVNNGGDLPDFTVDATSTTGDSGSAPVNPGNTLDTDDGLTVTVTNVIGDINEGDADTDTVVANASSTNPDGSTVTLTVSDTTHYSIDENGVITLTAAGAQIVNNGGDLPDFTVDATSTTGDSGSAPVQPGDTLDTDDGLTVTVTNVMGDINEGDADTDTVVANASSTNPDGSTVTLTVSDTTNYSIDENGVITLTAAGAQLVNNGGDLPDFTVDATSTTGDSGSAPVNPGNTLDTDDGLTVTISNVMGDINEGGADTDTVVANASSTNPDGSTVTLTVSDTAHYSIDENGVITLTAAGAQIVNNGGDLPDFTVDATSTTGDSGSAPVNPGNTLDTNDGLTVTISNVMGDINEGDADTDTVVANASSTNPDGSTVTLTVSDTTNYSIDANGVITLTVAGAKIVNDGGDLPDFTVDATSTTGDSGSAPVNPGNTLDTDDGLTVTVTNVIGDINEGDADTDTVVANASSTNPDGSTVTLTVSDTTHYSIDENGVITLTAAGAQIVNNGGDLPDFTVDATSTTGDSGSAPVNPGNTLDTDDGLTVTVTNVIGDINEGDADTDTVVANASSTNPDGSTVTLTVSDTTHYSIDANGVITLTVAGAKIVNDGGDLPDFTVDATSTTGDSGSAPVQPGDTLDTDDGLTVTISNVMGDINEGDADTDTVVANASSTNPDGSTVTLTVSDTANYSIDENGVITLTAAGAQLVNNGGDLPDFTVDATSTTGDSGSAPVNPGNTLDTNDGLTVTISNVMGDINEGDADTDTVVANASSTNPDGSTVTLTLSDTVNYSIDANGVITLTAAGAQIVNNGGDLPDFTVDATSTTGDSGSAPVNPGNTLDTDDGLTVTVTNVMGDINEGDADTDTVVANASSTNPDGSTVTLTVSDTTHYSIDENGVITLTVAGAQIVNDGGDLPDFTVDATSTTGDSGSAPVQPGDTLDTDDGLIVTVTNVIGDINEGDADTDTVVGNASSTNPDGSTVTLTVSDTANYSIDANGIITLTVAGAKIVNNGGDLPDFTVDATSTTGDSGSAPVNPGNTLDTDDGLIVTVTNVMGDINEGDADTDTVVANASSTNPDGSTVTLTVSDTTHYSIDANGVITLTVAGAQIVNDGGDLPDFTVDATSTTGDSGSAPVQPGDTLDTDDGLTVIVTNVMGDISEGDADTDTVVANASSTNPDGSTVTLTVSDTTNYSIDENGVITLTAAGAQIVNSGGDLPDFTVDATSTTGDSGSAPVNPGNTLDTDDGLIVTVTNVIGDINEGTADTDTVVANASSTNPDGSTVTLTVSDTANYSIDENGVITLTAAGAQIVNNGGDLPDFTVDATSTTGDSGSASVDPGDTLDVTIGTPVVDIAIIDANGDGIYNAEELGSDGTVTATLSVIGSDIGDKLTYTVNGDEEEIILTSDDILNGFSLEVEPGAVITAKLSDMAGNESAEVSATALSADTIAPVATDDTEMDKDAMIRLDEEPEYGVIEIEVGGVWVTMAVGVEYPADSNVQYVPNEDDVQAATIDIEVGTFDTDLDGGVAQIGDWGTISPNEKTAVYTQNGTSVTTTVSTGKLTAYNTEGHIGVGIGNASGNGLSEGETLTVAIAGENINEVTFTLAGLGGYFDESSGHATEVVITAFNSDGAAIGTQGGYRTSGSGEDTYGFTTNEPVAYFELTTSGGSGSYVVQNMTLSRTLADDFIVTTVQADGSESTGTVELDVNYSDDNIDISDEFPAVDGSITQGAIITDESTAIEIAILDNDYDADGALDISSITIVNQSANGVVSINANGTVIYTPVDGYSGLDSFTYTVEDVAGNVSNVATVTVDVKPIADTPILTITPDDGSEIVNSGLEGAEIKLSSISTALVDTDGSESLVLTVSGVPFGAILSDGNNTLTSDGSVIDISDWDLTNLTFNGSAVDTSSTYTLSFTATATETAATDSNKTASTTVELDVVVTDTAAVAIDDTDSVGYGGTIFGNVITGEGGQTNGADQLGVDAVKLSSVNGQNFINGELTLDTANGKVTFKDDGSYAYTSEVSATIVASGNLESATWSDAGISIYGYYGSDANQADIFVSDWPNSGLNVDNLDSATNNASSNAANNGGGIGVSAYGDVSYINGHDSLLLELDSGTKALSLNFGLLNITEAVTIYAYDQDGNRVDSLKTVFGNSGGNVTNELTFTSDVSYIAIKPEGDSWFVLNGAILPGETDSVDDETFDYVLEDSDGDTSEASLTIGHSGDSVAIVDSATVYEAGLDSGSDSDNSAAVVSGNLLDNDSGIGSTTSITAVGNTAVTAGQSSITVDTEQGTLTVYVEDDGSHRAGDYTYTLEAPADIDAESIIDSIDYQLTDNNSGNQTTAQLNITVIDDKPVATDIEQTLEAAAGGYTTNLVIVLDKSGSMDYSADDGTGRSRMDIAKEALSSLFNEYDNVGNVNVQFVAFDYSATKSAWYEDDINAANNHLDTINAQGGTSYDVALNKVMDDYDAPVADKSVVYFISDGEPSYNDYAIDSDEQAIWEQFLVSNGIDKSFAVGIGNGTSLENLKPIGYPNTNAEGDLEPNTFQVSTPADLESSLLGTIDGGSIKGNMSLLASSGNAGVVLGADGGFISAVVIDGITYTYQPNTGMPESIAVDTLKGGQFTLNFVTLAYEYKIELDTSITGEQDIFNITITDNDGDSSAFDVIVNLEYEANLDANRDLILTNIDGQATIEIPSLALMHNDNIGSSGNINTLNNADNALVSATDLDFKNVQVTVNQGSSIDDVSFDYQLDNSGISDSATVDFEYVAGATITGSDKSEILLGSDNNDILEGKAGNDALVAGAGDDRLYGGTGNDMLIGGTDNDILTGGSGIDTFVWLDGDEGTADIPAIDHITDFDITEDKLDLSDLLQGASTGSLGDYLELSFASDADDIVTTTINIKADGENGSISQVIILDNVDLSAAYSNVDLTSKDGINSILNDLDDPLVF